MVDRLIFDTWVGVFLAVHCVHADVISLFLGTVDVTSSIGGTPSW
jgi:hypothetical protein